MLRLLRHPPVRGLSSALNRPAPPPLPRDQQREFEELQRAAQTPLHCRGRQNLLSTPTQENPLNPILRATPTLSQASKEDRRTNLSTSGFTKTVAIGVSRDEYPTFETVDGFAPEYIISIDKNVTYTTSK
ncbi:hypothetical protein JVU11DRAFT_2719 [Chiua virens]|nr:hypothetical protein JVU11DRAFT_2719 [Chiua virens]